MDEPPLEPLAPQGHGGMLDELFAPEDLCLHPFTSRCDHQPRLIVEPEFGSAFICCRQCGGESPHFRLPEKAQRWWNAHFPQMLSLDVETEDVLGLEE